jgi:hypothetical protein
MAMVGSSAEQMKDAVGLMPHAPNEEDIWIEPLSWDTITNALLTKRDIVLPRSLGSLVLVTADYHIGRAWHDFVTVFGSCTTVVPRAAPSGYSRGRRTILDVKELAFRAYTSHVLKDFDPNSAKDADRVFEQMRRTFSRTRRQSSEQHFTT